MVDGVRGEHYINNINYFIFIISKSDEDFDDAKDPHVMVSENTHSSKRNFSVKLFFYRSAFFVGGFAVLLAGGIASRYSASLNMAKNTTNCSNSGH